MKLLKKILLVKLFLLFITLNSCKTISPTEAANGKAKCGKRLGK